MTQLDERPDRQTSRVERSTYGDDWYVPRERRTAGRIAATVLMLAAVTLVAASVGYVAAGGKVPGIVGGAAQTAGATPTAVIAQAPTQQPAAAQPAAPTAPPAPAEAPKPTDAPALAAAPPSLAPTAAPTSPPQAAQAKPTQPPPAAKPTSPPARASEAARKAQIEKTINDYFDALAAEDYGRAHQVCCTEAWRERYPLEQWQHNFDGVTDLRLTGEPRYLRFEDDVTVVDTDYTFVSGGARRNFTLRWTFKPVDGQWQADLAEAFSQ
jgi:hypothetical protein